MIEAVGYDVTYFNGAFKTVSPHDENRHYSPALTRLRKAIDWGMKSVYEKGDGRWLVVNKNVYGNKDPDDGVEYNVSSITVELVFLVPQRSDRHTELRAAVAHFEEVVAEYLGAPVDTTLRTIEGEETKAAKCATCGMHAIWVRIPQHGSEQHYCDLHAHQQPDFGDSDLLSYPLWERLQPINIY